MEVHGVVTSGVISPLIWIISIVTLLITPLVTTPELPGRHHDSDLWLPKLQFQDFYVQGLGLRAVLGV